METGRVLVEKVGGRSRVTQCFSKYPLKFMIPRKVSPAQTDAVWIYSLSYGGGIVSGDSISSEFTIGDGCTAVLTTQASTKVYKSVGSKCSEQILEAKIGSDALFAYVPDPVTCFSTASGRHESGEKWEFELYRSTNHILLEDGQPLFLDTVLLERESFSSISERMQGYQVMAMIIILGPKLKHVQNQFQEDVKRMMSEQLHFPSALGNSRKTNSDDHLTKPSFIGSCSVFGPKGFGVVVRIASMTTESVYKFLQNQLASMETLFGVPLYR
ncbi:urease accessory protein D isoform X2 [Malania oleifera]|uniref:urease accessory protein D isoform X2 n=1 Tax=Malania oleifera TaxID=397392 RepID=UPI0025ADD4CA|nr:urease accessory protein D isoform X2 [Malania oleifera]